MISTVISLVDHQTWNPVELTRGAISWPNNPSTVNLDSVAKPLPPLNWVEKGSQVITPASLDSVEGRVFRRTRNFEGNGYLVSDASSEVSVGDLLIPLDSDKPVLLLNSYHQGALVSGQFIALKPDTPQWGLWLWAVLSSYSGQKIRAAFSADTNTTIARKAALLSITVPEIPLDGSPVWNSLSEIEKTTHQTEIEAVETWWRTANLKQTNWMQEFAARTPLNNEGTVPLSNYCEDIKSGKTVPKSHLLDRQQPGALPVATVAFLSGRPIREWALDGVISQPGDILLSSVGNRPNARVSDKNYIVGSSVFVLHPKNPHESGALANYLNSQEGFDRRQVLLTGMTIERVSLKSLRELAVLPDMIDETSPRSQDSSPISSRLEHALWP